jgi:hypothetical protein
MSSVFWNITPRSQSKLNRVIDRVFITTAVSNSHSAKFVLRASEI